MRRENLRNVAVIAHVDHGKTTLIDGMLFEAHLFREGETVRERFLDSGDLERERGITITAKHVTVEHGGVKINIIDTPGHADFGGEVERVLKMADGVFLLVDAFDGPMPQTRFVLRKALELELKAIVVINKIDRSDARPVEVLNEVFDLFVDLNASEAQLEFPVVYASGRDRVATLDLARPGKDLSALFQAILDHVPPPLGNVAAPLSMQVTSIGYDSYVGRIGIGRVFAGRLLKKTPVALIRQRTGERETHVIRALYAYRGIEKIGVDEIEAGDIAAVVGIPTVEIGDTIADPESPAALPPIHVEEPTIHMLFRTNDSPFYGRDGHHVQGRKLRERLYQELEKNVALRIEDTPEADAWTVAGRGVLHLGILIETARREGYELAVGRPKVIFKEVDGKRHEPIETVIVDCAEKFSGKMIEILGGRRGELHHMDRKGDFVHMEFRCPSRGLIGLRTLILASAGGEAIFYHQFHAYEPYKGPIAGRGRGVIIASESGSVTNYALNQLADRGMFFVSGGEDVYEGQIVGENCKEDDIRVNICKEKHLTNVRAASADKKVVITPPRRFQLEEALEYLEDDELLEVTPRSLRLRKILLREIDRKRARRAERI